MQRRTEFLYIFSFVEHFLILILIFVEAKSKTQTQNTLVLGHDQQTEKDKHKIDFAL